MACTVTLQMHKYVSSAVLVPLHMTSETIKIMLLHYFFSVESLWLNLYSSIECNIIFEYSTMIPEFETAPGSIL
jgi:hypothetical protein